MRAPFRFGRVLVLAVASIFGGIDAIADDSAKEVDKIKAGTKLLGEGLRNIRSTREDSPTGPA